MPIPRRRPIFSSFRLTHTPPAHPRPENKTFRETTMRTEFTLAVAAALCGGIAMAAEPAPRAGTVIDSGTISGIGARNIGSAAMSGRISALAGFSDPSGKINLFVGSASGGVWKSTDGATTFKPVFDDQRVQSIGAIAVDPSNHQNIWVGTGEAWTRNSVS